MHEELEKEKKRIFYSRVKYEEVPRVGAIVCSSRSVFHAMVICQAEGPVPREGW